VNFDFDFPRIASLTAATFFKKPISRSFLKGYCSMVVMNLNSLGVGSRVRVSEATLIDILIIICSDFTIILCLLIPCFLHVIIPAVLHSVSYQFHQYNRGYQQFSNNTLRPYSLGSIITRSKST